MAPIQPVTVESADLVGWGQRRSWQMKVASAWAKYVPRGKGWFPRQVGRRFGAAMRDTVHTASGARLAVAPSSLDTYAAIERFGGSWDADVLETCSRLLSPGNVFYDIGANVGLMSVEVAKRFDDRVRVFAVEPQPWLAQVVAISAALNSFSNLQVFSMMLGKEPGEADLFVPTHSIHASAVSREAGAAAVRRPVATLDQLVSDGTFAPPDVIKIDVEGAEWDVFRGGRQTLATHRPRIIFESDANADRFGYTRRQLCDWLHETAGYGFKLLHADGTTEPADAIMDKDVNCNLLAS
jgi:FkbM family methyltransferase